MKSDELKSYATDEFLSDNTKLLVTIRRLEENKLITEVDSYSDGGGILSLTVKLDEVSIPILSEIIKDMETYQRLQDEEYDIKPSDEKVNLCMAINDSIAVHGNAWEVVRYGHKDRDGDIEYYEYITAHEKSNMDWCDDDDFWDDEEDY